MPMRPVLTFKYLSVLLMSLGLSACVVGPQPVARSYPSYPAYPAPQPVVIIPPPPPPRVEYPGMAPVYGSIWVGGFWTWAGNRHQWVPGHWEAPRPGYRWEPHRWDRDGERWHENHGRWIEDRRGAPPEQRDNGHDHDRERGWERRERERDDRDGRDRRP
jgi:hypothetical protein